MNQKTCLKCGHIASFEELAPQACSNCGAIYSKVEAAAAHGAPLRAAAAAKETAGAARMPAPRRPRREAWSDVQRFAERMRAESLYPTWRELVKWVTWFWYAFAVISLLVTMVATRLSFVPTLTAVGGALLVAIVTRVGKELSLMLADLADASVRVAAKQDEVDR